MFNVLIADDDKDARILLELYLKKFNYRIFNASNGIEALEIIKNNEISIALVDWMMPGITGIELCEQIRKLDLNRYVYLIMVTGRSEKEDTIEALHMGADDYIVKPFTFQELKVRISAAERVLKLENRLKEAYQKLYDESIHDVLTGTLNRRTLMNRISDTFGKFNADIGIIIVDIDDFKKINDKYGHLIGDDVLREFSTIISQGLRKSDFVGRYGGEEFLIVLPGLDLKESCKVAERIRLSLESEVFNFGGISLKLTASFGVTVLRKGDDIKTSLQRADDALYDAKKSGKNRVNFR